ncbi:TraB/GumN family protein [Lacihabitans sp. LS3-19]|uniref:TraB/GumN family protein n=1 Tax=Lacihabitans sp. LS3-19 TaxID=2487335 RepID=UPI0020CDB2D7|nr:TraB/GumN family protein [Lacihabitans sp. LS3-19]MCP9767323.1 TraB/GumN family protein [Lacihabitans sp. LS3-19]
MNKIIVVLMFAYGSVFSQERALLFEISGNELMKPSYIFGTFHLLCKDQFGLSDNLKSKIENSQQLVLELDMDDPKMMMSMMNGMKMKGDSSIKDLLEPAKYDFVNSYFQDSLKMPLKMMEKVKPMMLYSMLMPKLLGCEAVSLEMELVALAKKQKMEVLGLETSAFQMAIFDKISYKIQAKMLYETIENSDKSRKELHELMDAYVSKDFLKMQQLIEDSSDSFEGLEDELLKDRNLDWIDKIETFAKEKATFFAVGAGHLLGEEGVLSLLKKKGYIIKSIE